MNFASAMSGRLGNSLRAGRKAVCSADAVLETVNGAARTAWGALPARLPLVRTSERGLRVALAARGVNVFLSRGCIRAFAMDARAAAMREPSARAMGDELEARASFIERWTGSNQVFEGPVTAESVRIARRYALPRGWKVADSIVTVVPWPGGSASP